ncbi:MAG: hypothetical protein OEL91_06020 [Burkholderiaceae bacterium]|nr:hypothetical protein [Burkholderiaceae bacterium]
MLDDLRKPFFIIALVLIIIATLLEMGSPLLIGLGEAAREPVLGQQADGYGVPSLALLDSLLVFTVTLMGLSLLLPERVHGRVQGLATLIVSIIVLLAAIALLFKAILLVSLMLALLLAPIFGTIAYFAMYANFDRGTAAAVLSLAMLLKLGFAVCLALAHQRFLENKGLVLLVLTSLVAGLIVSFLHGFVPGFLASITDMIGAIIVAILALVWAIIFLVGSIISVVKAIV